MGADGGVSWMRLRDPSKYDRLMELLSPFPVTYWSNYSASGHDDDHYAYIKANPELQSEKYLLGVYGTDMVDTPGLESLRDIIDIIKYGEHLSHHGINAEKDTFLDLFLEKETRPDSWWDFGPNSGPNYILFVLDYFHRFDGDHYFENNPICKMTLKSWADEVESIVDVNRIEHRETWT